MRGGEEGGLAASLNKGDAGKETKGEKECIEKKKEDYW